MYRCLLLPHVCSLNSVTTNFCATPQIDVSNLVDFSTMRFLVGVGLAQAVPTVLRTYPALEMMDSDITSAFHEAQGLNSSADDGPRLSAFMKEKLPETTFLCGQEFYGVMSPRGADFRRNLTGQGFSFVTSPAPTGSEDLFADDNFTTLLATVFNDTDVIQPAEGFNGTALYAKYGSQLKPVITKYMSDFDWQAPHLTDGGLVIASKWDIARDDFHTFSQSSGEDNFVKLGVLYALVTKLHWILTNKRWSGPSGKDIRAHSMLKRDNTHQILNTNATAQQELSLKCQIENLCRI